MRSVNIHIYEVCYIYEVIKHIYIYMRSVIGFYLHKTYIYICMRSVNIYTQ